MSIIRLETLGPKDTGLTPLELDQVDFQSDLPEQNWHIYHQDEELGLTVGVWTTTSMQESFGPYPGDEFMHILEGDVSILDGHGKATIVKTGETFVVPNGIPVSWKQEGFCRKFFMTFFSPDAPVDENHDPMHKIMVFRENELESQFTAAVNSSGVPQKDAEVFLNKSGNMSAGMWETAALDTVLERFPVHEFVQMLSGSVTMKEEDGSTKHFEAGDCFFIPAGTVCAWKSEEPFRKFYCNLTPMNNS